MLSLVIGLPGAGKTLWIIDHIQKNYPDRPIYYYNIPELTLPWIKLEDPEKWYEAEDGAVIIIDEAQEVFPAASPNSAKPLKVSKFERHRHHGHDVYLLSQNRILIDSRVRGIVEAYRYLKRPFGLARTNVFLWQGMANETNKADLDLSVRSVYKHNKKLFGLYKSSVEHTHKARVPMKPIIMGVSLILLIIILIVFARHKLREVGGFDDEDQVEPAAISQTYQIDDSGNITGNNPKNAAKEMNAFFQPAVEGLPFTAPFYRSLLQAAVMPKIDGCGSFERTINGYTSITCTCNTQQGTKINMPENMCLDFIANGGWFDFTGDDDDMVQNEQSIAFHQQTGTQPQNVQ